MVMAAGSSRCEAPRRAPPGAAEERGEEEGRPAAAAGGRPSRRPTEDAELAELRHLMHQLRARGNDSVARTPPRSPPGGGEGAEVVDRLQLIMDTVATKFARCRAKVTERDEAIKRLHWRLRCAELQCADWCQSSSTSTHASRIAQGSGATTPAAAAAAASTASSRRRPPPAAAAVAESGASSGRSQHRGGATTASSSRESGGGPAEKAAQIGCLRQEVALLRRQNVELTNQVRARDQQVDGLTAMVRDMQATAQRQLGLCRRQLHLRDHGAAQGAREVLAADGGAGAGSRAAADPDAGGPSALAGPSPDLLAGRRAAWEQSSRCMVSSSSQGSSSRAGGGAAYPRRLGERGGSAARSMSAIARHKERLAMRRASASSSAAAVAGGGGEAALAAPAGGGGAGGGRIFSPRGRPHQYYKAGVGGHAGGAGAGGSCAGASAVAGTAAGIAQAAQAPEQRPPPAAAARGGPGSPVGGFGPPPVQAMRPTSADARARNRGNTMSASSVDGARRGHAPAASRRYAQ